jgi:hypothetical protein
MSSYSPHSGTDRSISSGHAHAGMGYGFLDLSTSNIPVSSSHDNHDSLHNHVIDEYGEHDFDDDDDDYDDNEHDNDAEGIPYEGSSDNITYEHDNNNDNGVEGKSSLSLELPAAYPLPQPLAYDKDDDIDDLTTSTAAVDMKQWKSSSSRDHRSTSAISASIGPSLQLTPSSSSGGNMSNMSNSNGNDAARTEFWSKVERVLQTIDGMPQTNTNTNATNHINGCVFVIFFVSLSILSYHILVWMFTVQIEMMMHIRYWAIECVNYYHFISDYPTVSVILVLSKLAYYWKPISIPPNWLSFEH